MTLYAGKRKHIGRDSIKTFCGNLRIQDTAQGKARLFIVKPDFCTCTPCLTTYYRENPLQQKRTKSTNRTA